MSPLASATALAHRCRQECWPSFRLGRAKGIAGVLGSDNTACTGGGAHSPAGDSISIEEARDTCPAVLAAATSLALRTSETQEAQAK